ncbi:MAG: hypothetical protein COB15_09950 [Flavobacteriales bacterium]|nr:MAG: hypothetical protein COB15_09950 [Flavobacteriales bacterium]
MKTILLTTVLSLLTILAFGESRTIEVTAKIKNVTVYNSSAEVNYEKEINLPKGKSTIVFSGLTPFIVENTINVSVLNPDVSIVMVTEKINYLKHHKSNGNKISVLNDSIATITEAISLLESLTEAYTVEKGLLFKDESIGGVSDGVLVAEIEKASRFFHQRYTAINIELYRAAKRKKQLNYRLDQFRNQIKQFSKNTSKSGSEISVTVMNNSSEKATFVFRFLTPKAGWAPIYDCKFKGAENPIEFIFRANVFNASGVSWNDVELKLSTASPTTGFDAPTLNGTSSKEEKPKTGNVKFREVQVRNTISEYAINHKYSIPSDAKPYLIDVDAYQMKADYHYLLIPKVDPFGFLMADIPNWNKYDLIPGTTNVYNKGSYMGKTFLNTYTENDTLSLYLGKDKNVIAIKKESNTNKEQQLIGNYYVDKSEINIVVKNNSSETLSIHVLDQIPVFEIGDKTKFNLNGIEQAIYSNKEGSLLWKFSLSANESQIIDYKYDIKIPKNDIGNYKPRRRRFRTISCPSF